MEEKIKKIEELKKKFRTRDRVVRVLSKNGYFRAVAIKNTETAKVAQELHNLDHISAFYLAKALAAAVMMSAFLKGEERISVDITGTGVISRVYAEALQVGEARGFVNFSQEYGKSPIVSLVNVLGAGMLKVARVLYNTAEPVVGVVPVVAGDISTDLAYYFSQSEQIKSAVILDVNFDDAGNITSSGGLIVQAMPGATEAEIVSVVDALSKIDSLSDALAADLSVEDILSKYLPFDFDVIKSTQTDFFCRCSRENFISKLLLLDQNEIKEMRLLGHRELVCQFCSKHFYLDDRDFDNILSEMRVRQN